MCECVESCHQALVLCTGYQSYRRLPRRHRLVHRPQLAGGGTQHRVTTASARMSLASGLFTRPPHSYTSTSSLRTWRPGKSVYKCQMVLWVIFLCFGCRNVSESSVHYHRRRLQLAAAMVMWFFVCLTVPPAGPKTCC